MTEAFLIDGARTLVGRYGGELSAVRPDDLVAIATNSRKLGLATMCAGVGQGTSLLIEGM